MVAADGAAHFAAEGNDLQRNQAVDVAVIGAGFSGLYMVYQLKQLGLSHRAFERGGGVGGTWYWNRYPGAYCDSESGVYSFSFAPELDQEWTWATRYPSQTEILGYLDHVAERFDLKSSFDFNTSVTAAHYDESRDLWVVETSAGERIEARFVITAVGCLSAGQAPPFPGIENFKGDWYHTGEWPHGGVDFAGKRVGIIGTGSSAVQAIPIIAEEAAHLTVFQRTPHFVVPAGNNRLSPERQNELKRDAEAIHHKCRTTPLGHVFEFSTDSAVAVGEEARRQHFEADWSKGGLQIVYGSFYDLPFDQQANDMAADFVRSKVWETVRDPEVAAKLIPYGYPIGAKRLVQGTNYYETYNRPNVELVDVRNAPIEEITATGIRTSDRRVDLDVIVFATGYDAMTGSLTRIDIRGRKGLPLADKWSDGWSTYLGLATAGFPNLFMITGPGSPSVLTNMPTAIEQHVEWVTECLRYMTEHKASAIEAEPEAEVQWVDHVDEIAAQTLFPKADSWYMGANIDGKPRKFTVYVGGCDVYRKRCDEVAAAGYEGFAISGKVPMVSPGDVALAAGR